MRKRCSRASRAATCAADTGPVQNKSWIGVYILFLVDINLIDKSSQWALMPQCEYFYVNDYLFANKWNCTLFTNPWTGESPIVRSQDYPIIAHTYPFSIQFLHQTTYSFGFSITQFVEYGWNGIFCETVTLHVISNWSCHRQQNNVLWNECILHPLPDAFAQLYETQYTILYV